MQKKFESLKKKIKLLLPTLNEKQRRMFIANEAKALVYVGGSLLSKLSGMSRQTIYHGIRNLDSHSTKNDIRKSGGGRKWLTEIEPNLMKALDDIIDSSTHGDPQATLTWTSKSLRKIEEILLSKGFQISHETVKNLLKEQDYTLQSNFKSSKKKERSS
jgi:transposase